MNSALPDLKLSFLLGVALLMAAGDLELTRADEAPAPIKTETTEAVAPSTNQLAVADRAAAPPAVEKKLSSQLQELLKMAERGLGDEVMIAWIKSSPTAFNVAPDDIVYLTDLGISEPVVKALIEHQGNGTAVPNPPPKAAPAAPPINPPAGQPSPNQPALIPNAEPSVAVTPAPEFETAPQTPQAQPQVVYVEQPAPVQYNYFYSSLAPYGSWIEVPDYGLCWRPTVAAIDTGWRPYCQRGRWLYTNCGWYWQSDYSWGWAPFHYGRWSNHPRCGWVWAPDSVWSPAWVTWRYSNAYCGWAPLPPGCGYRSSIGLTYHSAGISVGFDFGLNHDSYTFVPAPRFHDRTPWRYAVPPHQVVSVHKHTTVINNITHNSNNTLSNEGPGRDRIAQVTRSEIQKINIRDVPAEGSRIIKSDRLERGGKELAVYRPLNPTLPPEGSLARHEISKTPAVMSPRGLTETGQSPPRTIGSNPSTGARTPPAISRLSPANPQGTSLGGAASGGALGRTTGTLTEASLSKSAIESGESRLSPGRRVLNDPAPVVRTPSTSTALPGTRGNDSTPPVAGKSSIEQRSGTISAQPQRSFAPINPSSTRETSRVTASPTPATATATPAKGSTTISSSRPNYSAPSVTILTPAVNQRAPSVARSTVNSPARVATPISQPNYDALSARAASVTATPAYRQEVTKPIILSSPQPQSYSAPAPVIRVVPQGVPSYPSGAPMQSVPRSGSGPGSVPQASRASPVYSAPRPQSAPSSSAPRAVTSQPSGGDKSSNARTDRSSTR